jgi:hypothetical protein
VEIERLQAARAANQREHTSGSYCQSGAGFRCRKGIFERDGSSAKLQT